MKNGFTIIDEHTHVFLSDEVSDKIISSFNNLYNISFKNSGKGTVSDLLEHMQYAGVDYTIMANFAPVKVLHSNNMWTIDVAKKHKKLIPLVSFHPELSMDIQNTLSFYVSEGAKGIKLHPMAQSFDPVDKRIEGLYEYCDDNTLPVVFHCGRVSNTRLNNYSDLDSIMPVIENYPNIPIVLTHMVDGCAEDVIMLAEEHKNVYFDTSIVISGYKPLQESNEPCWNSDADVVKVINIIGADRVLFGSDYPWGSPRHDVERFLGMDLTDTQKRMIFSQNTMGLFNIPLDRRSDSELGDLKNILPFA